MSDLPAMASGTDLVPVSGQTSRRRWIYAAIAVVVVALAAGGLRYYQVQHQRQARVARAAEIAAARARIVAAARARGVPVSAAAVAATAAAAADAAPKSARVADASLSGSIFGTHSWYVPPPPPPYVPPPPPPPPPPPMAPPLPYVFLGSYTPSGDVTVFFLTRGDRVYDVKVGDTVDGIYQIESATSGQLVFNYKPLNQRQMMSIGVTP